MPQKKRIEDIAKGRTNLFSLPWHKCEPAQIQFNGRNTKEKLNTRTDFGDLPEFATSLIGGVKETLLGYMGDNGKFQITNGERRWLGAKWLDENKGITVLLPCLREGKNYTPAERNLDLLRTNNGKPLEMIEKAEAMKRLLQANMSPKEIAAKSGCSPTHVVDCLALLNLSPELEEAVRTGEIKATLAVDLSRQVPDQEKQNEILKTGRVKAAESATRQAAKKGGKTKASTKKTKITAKHLPVKTGKKAQEEKRSREGGQITAPPATGVSFSQPREKRPVGLARISGRDKTLDMLEELIDATSGSEYVAERFETLKLIADYSAGHVGLTKATKFILGMS